MEDAMKDKKGLPTFIVSRRVHLFHISESPVPGSGPLLYFVGGIICYEDNALMGIIMGAKKLGAFYLGETRNVADFVAKVMIQRS